MKDNYSVTLHLILSSPVSATFLDLLYLHVEQICMAGKIVAYPGKVGKKNFISMSWCNIMNGFDYGMKIKNNN